ncbi:hypothetical protein BHE74_00033405 [Ensete ventricosum]|nr:hypothetical protein GW17_00028000 [Ensete ventricosum]RWW59642.1 hypothetical protein BHE74_00033405 [Ensete ventricosum]RZS10586.1 hypothetical protein BHM03_00041826 [Ensete ventricosum]
MYHKTEEENYPAPFDPELEKPNPPRPHELGISRRVRLRAQVPVQGPHPSNKIEPFRRSTKLSRLEEEKERMPHTMDRKLRASKKGKLSEIGNPDRKMPPSTTPKLDGGVKCTSPPTLLPIKGSSRRCKIGLAPSSSSATAASKILMLVISHDQTEGISITIRFFFRI